MKMKRWVAILIVLVSIVSILPTPWGVGVEADAAMVGGLKAGDIYELGSYPQTKVTDQRLITLLNAQYASWGSYNYYNSAGVRSDYMKYKDVVYNGERYRAVKFSEYRPISSQQANGYLINEVHWFRFEPLKWILLDE